MTFGQVLISWFICDVSLRFLHKGLGRSFSESYPPRNLDLHAYLDLETSKWYCEGRPHKGLLHCFLNDKASRPMSTLDE
jgi:hypothetical protein